LQAVHYTPNSWDDHTGWRSVDAAMSWKAPFIHLRLLVWLAVTVPGWEADQAPEGGGVELGRLVDAQLANVGNARVRS
jgi:hypothetical protein